MSPKLFTANPAGRLVSLDVFRGITIAAMVLVNNPGTWSSIYWPLEHAEWNGWTPTDLVFPFFLFIVGVSITLAFARRVEEGSVKRQTDGVTVNFVVTDTAKVIPVVYTGILPDLFKEGKGVVAQGKLSNDGVFRADEVLAKHDENYMPPEAADALNQADKARQTVLVQ